jgi:hypothetical protein
MAVHEENLRTRGVDQGRIEGGHRQPGRIRGNDGAFACISVHENRGKTRFKRNISRQIEYLDTAANQVIPNCTSQGMAPYNRGEGGAAAQGRKGRGRI